MNPATRRSGGMHYTSITNIHKLIEPLFLDGLKAELQGIKEEKTANAKKRRLQNFQDKLSKLVFLDPACGSGNFLTETYIALRRLENEVLKLIRDDGQITWDSDIIKVSIGQFYGLEINDFAVTVAKTALWIAESQMMKETEEIVNMNLDFLPLKSYPNITECNALRIDWADLVPRHRLSYILGNPPFVGARMMAQGSQQKREIEDIFGNINDVQDLDYVTCWYKKAAQYIQNTQIEVGFVSTNSICQGSQVPILWNVLLNEYHLHINFAHQTFKWSNEAKGKAAVNCVIIGFGVHNRERKKLYSYPNIQAEPIENIVENISPYLLAGSNSFVTAQKIPICDVPEMKFGSQPRDGGFFILTPEERDEILSKEPILEKVIKPFVGADEFIKGKTRYCIWLHNEPLDIIKNSKILKERISAVEKFRLNSTAKTTNAYSKVPAIFAQIAHPYTDYLIIPSVSSERRRYIPIGFMDKNTIASNAVQIVPNATLYHFGILTSNVHMAWVRTVCGRLEMRYRYSKEIVYNTFPWPDVDEKQKAVINSAAQAILDERARYPETSLADLYDPILIKTTGLLKIHHVLDTAVMKLYGFSVKETSEAQCVAALMEKYRKLINGGKN